MAKNDAGEGAETAMSSGTTFTVSVLRCRKTGHVLFLEAGKDFVDTLMSFLLLPVGTILHLLSKAPVQGKPLVGVSSIYESVGNMDSTLLHVHRKYLVEPKPVSIGISGASGLLQGSKSAEESSPSDQIIQLLPKVYYRCDEGCPSLSTTYGSCCETCRRNEYGDSCNHHTTMNVLGRDLEALEALIIKILSDPVEGAGVRSTGQGFVRENITYMVTDSLEIMPSTTIRSIKVLNKLKVATLADLISSDVSIDITKVLQLLRSALTSSTCLNDVFGKN